MTNIAIGITATDMGIGIAPLIMGTGGIEGGAQIAGGQKAVVIDRIMSEEELHPAIEVMNGTGNMDYLWCYSSQLFCLAFYWD